MRCVLFAVDRRLLAKLEPVVQRVLVVDPNLHAARLLTEIMKGLGSRDVVVQPDQDLALMAAEEMEPGIVFIERSGEGLDGEALARALRRSHLECRTRRDYHGYSRCHRARDPGCPGFGGA